MSVSLCGAALRAVALSLDGRLLAGAPDAGLYASELRHMKPHPSVFAAAPATVGVADPAAAILAAWA